MRTTGRITNFFSTRTGRLARWFGRLHARAYRRFRGRRFTRFLGTESFLLTVRGRRSGEPRSVMLICTRRGDDVIVCGSNGGNPRPPSWYLNLRDAGAAEVLIAGESWPVVARHAEGAERDELWQLLCSTYPDFATYQALTERRLPVVVLERSGDSP